MRKTSGNTTARAPTPNDQPKRTVTTRNQTAAAKVADPTPPDWDALAGSDPAVVFANVEDAKAHLCSDSLLAPETPITTTTIACAMLIIANRLPAKLIKDQKALRALAVLLHDEDISTIASLIQSRVADLLDPLLDSAKTAATQTADATADLTNASERIHDNIDTLARQIDELHDEQGHLAEMAEHVDDALDRLQGQSSRLSEQIDSIRTQPQPAPPQHTHTSPPPPSFQYEQSATPEASQPPDLTDRTTFPPLPTFPDLMRRMAPPHEVIASSQAADRNVIFDLSAVAAGQAKSMTEAQLVERANIAVEQIGPLATGRPVERIFASAKLLERGGIRYLTTSAEAADWIRRPEVKREFLAAFFGSESTLANRTHSTIVEFVPIHFNADSHDTHRELELANGLPCESIAKCHWLKKPTARGQNQTRAHLEVTFTTISSANTAIRNRLAIDGRNLLVRKKLAEPEKCTKCQMFTAAHRAKTCRKSVQCAHCLGSHWMSECINVDPQCINCKQNGLAGDDIAHRVSDRTCPAYLQQVEKKRRTHPENKYKFFLDVSNPTTWELAEWQPLNDPHTWYANGAETRHNPAPNPPGAWIPPHRREQTESARGRSKTPRPSTPQRPKSISPSPSSPQASSASLRTPLRQQTLTGSFLRSSSLSSPRVPSTTLHAWT